MVLNSVYNGSGVYSNTFRTESKLLYRVNCKGLKNVSLDRVGEKWFEKLPVARNCLVR
jgi:hypothetical protein